MSFSLSYFLLVAAMEACASRFSDAEPVFEDFSDGFRRAIGQWQAAHHVEAQIVDDLRNKLLDSQKHVLRARRRFIDVVAKHLPEDFWQQNAGSTNDPGDVLDAKTGRVRQAPGTRVTRERLEEHLKAVYDARSDFVHEAVEFGLQADIPGYDWVPSFETHEKTGAPKQERQMLPTLPLFARASREVLLSVLRDAHAHPDKYADAPDDAEVDPERWLVDKGSILYLTVGGTRPAKPE